MTQEEKQLLLVDLSARLPYKARGRFSLACDSHSFIYFDCLTLNIVDRFVNSQKSYWDEIGTIQLYLRPMSSMTEEEIGEYTEIGITGGQNYDWLNAHHFDYRNLIEKGLALEAPEGMYNG